MNLQELSTDELAAMLPATISHEGITLKLWRGYNPNFKLYFVAYTDGDANVLHTVSKGVSGFEKIAIIHALRKLGILPEKEVSNGN